MDYYGKSAEEKISAHGNDAAATVASAIMHLAAQVGRVADALEGKGETNVLVEPVTGMCLAQIIARAGGVV